MKKFTEVIVCIGAAVVICGAWAKLTHKSFADTMLTVGLLTEAAIFVLYAILALISKESVENSGEIVDDGEIKKLNQSLKNIFKNA